VRTMNQANAPAVVGSPEPARPEAPRREMTCCDSTLSFNRHERGALGAAYRLLSDIARRHNLDTSPDEAA
jgi:hypothetical protein